MILCTLCSRHPASMRPIQRCCSIASRTLAVVNNTTSGLQPWQLPAEATSAQRSQWSLLGKVGAPGELMVEEKAKEIFVKVMRESLLEMAMKRQHDLAYTDRFHHTPSFCLSLSGQLIDSPIIDWVAAMLQETLLLIMWWWTGSIQWNYPWGER